MRHIIVKDSSGVAFTLDSSFAEVYTDGKLVLYDLAYTYGSSYETINLIDNETRHHYFIFAKDSLFGFDLDGYRTEIVQQWKVDSVMNAEWIGNRNMGKYYEENNFRLTASRTEKNNLHETYLITSKKDTSLPAGTCSFDYTKHLPGSFSTPLKSPEEKKGMYVSSMQLCTESSTCKITIKYTQKEITGINPNIIQFFTNYPKIYSHGGSQNIIKAAPNRGRSS